MEGSLVYFILINSEKKAIVIDYTTTYKDCQPDVGYETEFDDWSTSREEYMQDDDIFFDSKKAFKDPGIYKVSGYDNSCDTPDGFYEDYKVLNIEKISDLPYKI